MDCDNSEMLFGVEVSQDTSQDLLKHADQFVRKTYDQSSEINPPVSARDAFLGHGVQHSAQNQRAELLETLQRLQSAPSDLLYQPQSSTTLNVEASPVLPPGDRDRYEDADERDRVETSRSNASPSHLLLTSCTQALGDC